jgi:2-oxo-3-hexenedioate decarboxylase
MIDRTAHWAQVLLDAQDNRTHREPLTDEWPDLDVETAYAIQDASFALRLRRGERRTGVKLGLTSRAKQERMGIESPLVAWLTDAMTIPFGAAPPYERLIHPRVEPEIAFVMAAPLQGPVTAAAALGAVGSVHAALEIIDSRFTDFRFTLPDVIADNASAGGVVLNPMGVSPASLDLELEACLLEVDGRVVASATGAAVQGHPAEAVVMAVNTLASRGMSIEAGDVVLTGGMTDAVPINPLTQVVATFTSLGSVGFARR